MYWILEIFYDLDISSSDVLAVGHFMSWNHNRRMKQRNGYTIVFYGRDNDLNTTPLIIISYRTVKRAIHQRRPGFWPTDHTRYVVLALG